MNKLIAPAVIVLALAGTSIAAAPVPASAAADDAVYSMAYDVRVDINEAKGSARVVSSSGVITVKWVPKRNAYAAYIASTKATYQTQISKAGKDQLVKVLRSKRASIKSGKQRYVNLEALASDFQQAAVKAA